MIMAGQRSRAVPSHKRWRGGPLAIGIAVVLVALPVFADPVSVTVSRDHGRGRIVFTWPEPVGHRTSTGNGQLKVDFSRPIDADFGPVAHLAPWLGAAEVSEDGTSVSFALAPGLAILSYAEDEAVVVELLQPPVPPQKTADRHAPASTFAGVPHPVPRPRPAAASFAAAAAVPDSAADAAAASPSPLVLDWGEPVAAAQIDRAESSWIVFAAPPQPDLGRRLAAAAPAVGRIELVGDGRETTILRVTTPAGRHLTLGADGTAWTIEHAPAAPVAAATIPMTLARAASGGGVTLPVAGATPPIALADPVTGEMLVVVPLATPGHAVVTGASTPAFAILPSAQGVVIAPRVDGLTVRADDAGLHLSHAHDLPVTDPADRAERNEAGLNQAQLSWLGNPAEAAGTDRLGFLKRRLMLERAAADGFGGSREQARLALCHHFLIHQFAAECLGVLRLIAEDRPAVATEAHYSFLMGAAAFLAGRPAQARDSLAAESLRTSDEARLWRAAVTSTLEAAAGAPGEEVGSLLTYLSRYPSGIQIVLGVPLAEAAITRGRLDEAQPLVEGLERAARSPAERAWAAYLRGKLAAGQGNSEGAREAWAAAIASPARAAHARAEYARVILELERQLITTEEAVQALDRLQAIWRGDRLEFDILRHLGPLQIAAGRPAEGLRTLQTASDRFGHLKEAASLRRDTARLFERIFLDEEGEQLSPIAAIALYRDFVDVVPPGAGRRRLSRRLADRLIASDLLPQAAGILDDLLAQTPSGPERADLGLLLAQVYLADGNAGAAHDALLRSDDPAVPADLAARRRLLAAQALVALGQGHEAVRRLGDDQGIEADRVRAAAHRSLGDWRGAAIALDRVLTQRPAAEIALDLLTASGLAGDERHSPLRDLPEGRWTNGEMAKALDLMSRRPSPPAATVDDIRASVAEAAAIKAVLGHDRTTSSR